MVAPVYRNNLHQVYHSVAKALNQAHNRQSSGYIAWTHYVIIEHLYCGCTSVWSHSKATTTKIQLFHTNYGEDWRGNSHVL